MLFYDNMCSRISKICITEYKFIYLINILCFSVFKCEGDTKILDEFFKNKVVFLSACWNACRLFLSLRIHVYVYLSFRNISFWKLPASHGKFKLVLLLQLSLSSFINVINQNNGYLRRKLYRSMLKFIRSALFVCFVKFVGVYRS